MSKWEKKSLESLLELVIDHRGKTPKKMGFDDFHQSGYPVLSARHVKTSGLENLEAIRFANEEMYKKWMREETQKGDIVLTSEAPMGEVFYIDGRTKYLLGQRVFGLRPKKDVVEPLYLLSWLAARIGQEQLMARASGSTVLGIRQSELLKIEVDVPPLEVQRVIAKNRQDISLKIELNRQTNQTLEKILKPFSSWFVDLNPRAKIIAQEVGADTATQELAAQAIICGALTLEQLADIEHNLAATLQEAIHTKLSHNSPTPINAEQLATTAALFPNALVESELGEIPEGWAVKACLKWQSLLRGHAKRSEPTYWGGDICWFSVKAR